MTMRAESVLVKALVALVAVVGIGSASRADSTADARKAIQAQYESSNAAMAKKNLKGYVAIYDPGYMRIDSKGQTLALKVVKQRMALMFSQTVSAKGYTVIVSLSVNSNTAVARVKESRTFAYSSPQTGSVSNMLVACVNDDTWKKSGSSWVAVSSKTVSEKDTIDGKPVVTH